MLQNLKGIEARIKSKDDFISTKDAYGFDEIMYDCVDKKFTINEVLIDEHEIYDDVSNEVIGYKKFNNGVCAFGYSWHLDDIEFIEPQLNKLDEEKFFEIKSLFTKEKPDADKHKRIGNSTSNKRRSKIQS